MALLKLEQLTKTYMSGSKRLTVLRQFDLTVESGQIVAIVGRSGSGKTTLLNCIAGLDRLDSGRITLGDEDLTSLDTNGWDRVRRDGIGFVFQFNQLLPEFTALENVMLPGLLTGSPEEEVRERARDLLNRMDMTAREDHRPARLSGGEQQRAAIARALINRPRLVLADEPTGSLDLESGRKVFDLLLSLQQEFGITCLVVTHNPGLADMCARIHSLDSAGNASGHLTSGS
jgi:lipoprotein-releasing system ATP-binding protein